MMAMSRSATWMLVLMVVMAVPFAAQAQQDKKASAGEVKKVRINDAIRDIAAEGREAIKGDGTWPRKEADFAKTHGLEADSEDVLKALGRRLDRNEPLDGYIKWQLLSFNPNFAEASGRDWQDIVNGLPQVVQRAQPSPAHRRLFAAAEAQPNERNADRLREIVADLEKEHTLVQGYSTPAVKYRDAVIKQIPEANGVRMQVRLMDIEHRYVAGHDSFAAAVKDLIADAKRLKDDRETLPPAVRQDIAAKVARLRTLKNPMIDDVNLMASGAIKTVPFPAVFRGKDYENLTDYLGVSDPKKK